MTSSTHSFLRDMHRGPEYFAIGDGLFLPDKPLGQEKYRNFPGFARSALMRQSENIRRVCSIILDLTEGRKVRLPIESSCFNCSHKQIDYEVDCGILDIALGEIMAIEGKTRISQSNLFSICPFYEKIPRGKRREMQTKTDNPKRVPLSLPGVNILLQAPKNEGYKSFGAHVPHIGLSSDIQVSIGYNFQESKKTVGFISDQVLFLVLTTLKNVRIYSNTDGGIYWRDISTNADGDHLFIDREIQKLTGKIENKG